MNILENYIKDYPCTLKIKYDTRDNLFVISIDEIKVFSHGKTLEEALKNFKEAMECHNGG